MSRQKRIRLHSPTGAPGPAYVWVRPGLLRRLGLRRRPQATIGEFVDSMREEAARRERDRGDR